MTALPPDGPASPDLRSDPDAAQDDALASSDPGPLRVEEFIAALRDRAGGEGSVLLTRGARDPARFALRRTVAWALQGTTIASLHEGWLEVSEFSRLFDWLRRRGPVQQGGCDGGPGAPITVAWSADAGRVRVWVGGSLRLDHDDRWVRIWRGRCALVPRAEVTGVRVSLTPTRDRLRVSLRQGPRQQREIVSRQLWGVSLDPGYDRAELVADGAWAVDLAGTLSDALGVECAVPAALRPD